MSLRLLCLIGLVAGIHCGLVRRDLGHKGHKGGSSYGAPPAPAYGAPAPAYGAPPASSYVQPQYGPPIYYEDDKLDLKAKLEEFKSKIIGHLGYVKGSILAAKGKHFLKKAQHYQEKGEKLLGIGESLKALKPEKHHEPAYAPPPAYAAPAPAYSAPAPIAYSG